jgi:chitin disaccharide deacetylase
MMNAEQKSQTNRLLGYPDDARLLIINADDFGMCSSVNDAIIRTLQAGIVQSTTLMVPCAWANPAMQFLKENPSTPFGVHLTALCDSATNHWGPITPSHTVPSLIDITGDFYTFDRMAEFRARARLDHLEVEFRAQIETVLAAGLQPSHLDWHSLRFGHRTDIIDLMFRLAREYGLALRPIGQAMIKKLQHHGLPGSEHDFLDSYGMDPVHKSKLYAQILHQLPPGLSEWGVHPGLDGDELLALEPADNHERQTDYDFLVSQAAQDLIQAENILLLSYRALQHVWQSIP